MDKKTAEKIVELYGKDTIDIIKKDKSSLDKIKSDYLKKFDTTDQNFSKMKTDYLNGNCQTN